MVRQQLSGRLFDALTEGFDADEIEDLIDRLALLEDVLNPQGA